MCEQPRYMMFDFHRTLVDFASQQAEIELTTTIFRKHGRGTANERLAEITQAEVAEYVKKSNRGKDAMLHNLGFGSFEQFREYWHSPEAADFRNRHLRFYPDIGALEILLSRGRKLGLVTSGPRRLVESQLEKLSREFGTRQIFSAVVCGNDNGIIRKPHPSSLTACIGQFGVRGEGAPYVGDSPEDMRAAAAAGVPGVRIWRREGEVPRGISGTVVVRDLYGFIDLVLGAALQQAATPVLAQSQLL